MEAGLCDRVPVVLRIALLEGRRKDICIALFVFHRPRVAGVGVLDRMEDEELARADDGADRVSDDEHRVSDDEHANGGAGGSRSGAGGGEMELVFMPDGLSKAGQLICRHHHEPASILHASRDSLLARARKRVAEDGTYRRARGC